MRRCAENEFSSDAADRRVGEVAEELWECAFPEPRTDIDEEQDVTGSRLDGVIQSRCFANLLVENNGVEAGVGCERRIVA